MRMYGVVRLIPRRAAAPFGPPNHPISPIRGRAESQRAPSHPERPEDLHAGPNWASASGFRADVPIEFGKGNMKHRTFRNDDRTFDHILQFSNISRPVIADQGLHRFRRDGVSPAAITPAEFLNELTDQQRNIFLSLAQRWHSDGKDIQPIIQIGPNVLVFDHCFQIAIR
jgi:hypothetical protein